MARSPPRYNRETKTEEKVPRMKDDASTETVQRLQALIARETGRTLPPAAEEEMASIVQRAHSGAADLSVQPREVTILLADLRGFTALSATQPAGTVITTFLRLRTSPDPLQVGQGCEGT